MYKFITIIVVLMVASHSSSAVKYSRVRIHGSHHHHVTSLSTDFGSRSLPRRSARDLENVVLAQMAVGSRQDSDGFPVRNLGEKSDIGFPVRTMGEDFDIDFPHRAKRENSG